MKHKSFGKYSSVLSGEYNFQNAGGIQIITASKNAEKATTALGFAASRFGVSSCTPAFGSTPNPTPLFGGNENKSAPLFRVTENKTLPLFSAAETKAQVFGAQDNKITAVKNAEKATTALGFAASRFGVSSCTPAFTCTTPAVGNASQPAFATDSTQSMIAASKPANNALPPVATSKLVTSRGNAAQPTSQSSTDFNFSSNNSAPTPAEAPVQKNFFTFGNNQSTQQPGTGFGSTANFNASAVPDTTPENFWLNPPKPEGPVFGQTAHITSPMFGTSQSTPSLKKNQSTSALGFVAPPPSSGFDFEDSVPVASSGSIYGGQGKTSPVTVEKNSTVASKVRKPRVIGRSESFQCKLEFNTR